MKKIRDLERDEYIIKLIGKLGYVSSDFIADWFGVGLRMGQILLKRLEQEDKIKKIQKRKTIKAVYVLSVKSCENLKINRINFNENGLDHSLMVMDCLLDLKKQYDERGELFFFLSEREIFKILVKRKDFLRARRPDFIILKEERDYKFFIENEPNSDEFVAVEVERRPKSEEKIKDIIMNLLGTDSIKKVIFYGNGQTSDRIDKVKNTYIDKEYRGRIENYITGGVKMKYFIYKTEPGNEKRIYLTDTGTTEERGQAKPFERYEMREIRKKYPLYGIEEVEEIKHFQGLESEEV